MQGEEFCNNLAHQLWRQEQDRRENIFKSLINRSSWAIFNSVATLPNNTVAIGDNGVVKIWDKTKQKIVKRLEGFATQNNFPQVTCLTHVGENRLLVGASGINDINVMNYVTGELERVISLPSSPECAVHVEGSCFAIGGRKEVYFVDINSDDVKESFAPHKNLIYSLAKLTDTLFASTSADGMVCI